MKPYTTRMKHYLVTCRQQDGEHEHRDFYVISAANIDEADKTAAEMFTQDNCGFDAEDSFFGYGDGLTMTKHTGTQEISASDAEVIRRLGL